MALGGAHNNEKIEAIQYAQIINRLSGAAVIAPWEVDLLPNEWINVFYQMAVVYPKMRKGTQQAKKIVDEIKRNHPTYGKRMH